MLQVGDVLKYQGKGSFTGKKVMVRSLTYPGWPELVTVEVLKRGGVPTGRTAGVHPNWLASLGGESVLQAQERRARKLSAVTPKKRSNYQPMFGLLDAEEQMELLAQGDIE